PPGTSPGTVQDANWDSPVVTSWPFATSAIRQSAARPAPLVAPVDTGQHPSYRCLPRNTRPLVQDVDQRLAFGRFGDFGALPRRMIETVENGALDSLAQHDGT